jgi:hypothetical protein
VTSLRESIQAQDGIHSDLEVPKDEAQRKARIERGMQECHESLLDAIRDLDRTLLELEKEQGIFERWFGYRTSV